MKRIALASAFLTLGSFAACAVDEPPPVTGTGGTSYSGAGGAGPTGGASGTSPTGGASGTDATGGASGTGTGGTPPTGGTGGDGTVTGGTGGDGTVTGGSGGDSTTGGAGGMTGGTGTGGMTGGTGGMTGGTGQGGMTGGTGGKAMGGAGTGGGKAVGIPDLFPPATNGDNLDGFLITIPCGEDNTAGTDCASGGSYYRGTKYNCANGALDFNRTFAVGGTPGTTYRVVFHFYGIMEPKIYGTNVTREAANRPGNQDNGANPTGWATCLSSNTNPVCNPATYVYPGSDYNTYELHVDNNMNQEVGQYYMNADTMQGHWTYVTNYEKTINIIGGGRVRLRVYDRNCREIKNCGEANVAANNCDDRANARIINVSGAMPAPPNQDAAAGGLLQPQLLPPRTAGSAGQWWLIDAVRVEP